MSTTTAEDHTSQMYQCQYCSFTSHWSHDVMQHEQQKHGNYSSYNHEDAVDTSNGLSALLIDEIQELGEDVESPHDDIMMIENDDDEDDAYALGFSSRFVFIDSISSFFV
jgi:hypothetical protein